MTEINSRIPQGPLAEKWKNYKAHQKLVNPANKRRLDIIVVGTGLAGASAAASLAEMGFNVLNFCIQDSPRRAHSIAAQGGINAAKNYQNDGDSVYRLFYDTIKGGDYRSREANVYRLAEVSNNIIDQCVAQGVPFAREYGGLLDNRSFGGAQVSRTFYARGQTGQQLLLGAYSALSRQIGKGKVKMYTRHGRPILARPIITPSTSYCSNFSLQISADVTSPLPMMGICMRGLFFTLPINVQSASPVYICERVRPWMVSAAIPQSCSCSANSSIIRLLQSHPRRVFTVTGICTASTTARVISSIRGIFRNNPAPAPLPATRFTGHPKLISRISGPASSQILAASTMAFTSLP